MPEELIVPDRYCHVLKVKPFHIHTGALVVVLNDVDAKELGIFANDRVRITNNKKKLSVVAVADITHSENHDFIKENEIGVFSEVIKRLDLKENDLVEVCAVELPKSVEFIKKKLNNQVLTAEEINEIVKDLDENRLSSIEASAFVSAVYVNGFNLDETVAMTRALSRNGQKISMDLSPIVDKHSIGGINGRVTMIVVPIVAAAGLFIPKTSSRSITSAAGTADAMEVLANVSLNFNQIKKITQKVGGVIAWGGALDLAPVDDKIIKIEHPLSLDPQGQVIASVMAKKHSVGSQFVVVDLPIGPGLKVSDKEAAEEMAKLFVQVGKKIGVKVESVLTDGTKPTGKAFGPALEAKYVLEVLENKFFDNLAQKSCELSGVLLELAGKCKKGQGFEKAKEILQSGKALDKMKEIIKAQGGKIFKSEDVELGKFVFEVKSESEGEISNINGPLLTQIARVAGAPADKKAGVLLHVEEGDNIKKGDLLFQIFASNERKFDSAKKAAKASSIQLEKTIIERFV